ncbi:hypothetical protein DFP73DRAFT_596564 [Morchella snyderi]|nr:hypothetical protein DFP73DRAFT_596564 [Morchella snyderi]
MPLTNDLSQYFSEEALELIRHWVNQGYRKSSTDPFVRETVIPEPQGPPATWRIRKNIRNLSPEELQTEAGEEWNRKPADEYNPRARGYLTANIPEFDEEQPEEDYPYLADFDGLFEQPRDNIHGWIGPHIVSDIFSRVPSVSNMFSKPLYKPTILLPHSILCF